MAKRIPTVDLIHASPLFEAESRVLAMLSGGSDSVCMAHLLKVALGPERMLALHVNHGLRPEADADQRFCEQFCDSHGIRLLVVRVEIDESAGNTEAIARDMRYSAAERVRTAEGLDLIATAHTADDQIETVLYRLVSSPGRRSLLGIAAERGAVVRPLLDISAEGVIAYCAGHGLEWVEDPTNSDTNLARNRLRHEVVPQLRRIHAGADQNLLATLAELRVESELLDGLVDAAIADLGAGGVPPAVELSALAALEPALRRLVLRRLAEQAAGVPLALTAEHAMRLEALAGAGGTAELDLPGGVRATCEYGMLRFGHAFAADPPSPVALPTPGRCRFGAWEIVCAPEPGGHDALSSLHSADEALIDGGRLAASLEVRCWREGDRMQPLGMTGRKSLQDVFTDQKVPRSLRRVLPIVVSADEIVWVAGVGASERFKVEPDSRSVFRLSAGARSELA